MGEFSSSSIWAGPSGGVLMYGDLDNSHQGWIFLGSNRHRKVFVKPGSDTNRTAFPFLWCASD